MSIPEIQSKIQEIFFNFEIIAFELVALDTCISWGKIRDIGCQYVNKQSQDVTYYQRRIVCADFVSEW